MSFDPIDFARNSIQYHTGKEWPEKLNKLNYILRSDGLWEVRKNKIGTFYKQLYAGAISGFPKLDAEDPVAEGFELSLPKIPRRLLSQVLAFFRKLCDDHDFEAYAQFYWNPERQEYWIRVPQQRVSKGRVEYVSASDVDPSNVLVCEIHSHNSMGAFFSGTDDRDEKSRGDRFFGVVGRLDTSSPEMKLSYILGGGERTFVSIDELFDDEEFPREWLQQVVYLDDLPNPEFVSENEEDLEEALAEEVEEEEEYVSDTYEYQWREQDVESGEDEDSEWMAHQAEYDKYRLRRGV